MTDSRHYRDKARQCRQLLKHVSRPEIAHQLRLWAEEFDHLAQRQVFERERERNSPPRTVDLASRRWPAHDGARAWPRWPMSAQGGRK